MCKQMTFRFYLYKILTIILILSPALVLFSNVYLANLDIQGELNLHMDEKVTFNQVYMLLYPISITGFFNTFLMVEYLY